MHQRPNQTLFVQKQNYNPFKPNNKSKSLTTVRQLLTQMDFSLKKRPQSQRKKEVCLDRQEIRRQMKQKWKDPGNCNFEFSNTKALKGRFLNEWQMERIFLASRSYQTPKDFKGYKNCTQSREFPKVTKDMYSEKFQKYLSTIEQKNENEMFNPKKMYTESATTSYRDSRFQPKDKDRFQAFTTQSKSFGMGTVVWKSGLKQKLKTLDY